MVKNDQSQYPNKETPNARRGASATVARVLDEYTVVINRGAEDGVEIGQTFLVYYIADEVVDPETNESLGNLELVRGRGAATHVQPRMSTIRSTTKHPGKTVRKRNLGLLNIGTEVIEESGGGTVMPFEDVDVGDKAKPI